MTVSQSIHTHPSGRSFGASCMFNGLLSGEHRHYSNIWFRYLLWSIFSQPQRVLHITKRTHTHIGVSIVWRGKLLSGVSLMLKGRMERDLSVAWRCRQSWIKTIIGKNTRMQKCCTTFSQILLPKLCFTRLNCLISMPRFLHCEM